MKGCHNYFLSVVYLLIALETGKMPKLKTTLWFMRISFVVLKKNCTIKFKGVLVVRVLDSFCQLQGCTIVPKSTHVYFLLKKLVKNIWSHERERDIQNYFSL